MVLSCGIGYIAIEDPSDASLSESSFKSRLLAVSKCSAHCISSSTIRFWVISRQGDFGICLAVAQFDILSSETLNGLSAKNAFPQ